ncbi:hypothetical protein TNCT_346931, partial [Trichonephila clavata]
MSWSRSKDHTYQELSNTDTALIIAGDIQDFRTWAQIHHNFVTMGYE